MNKSSQSKKCLFLEKKILSTENTRELILDAAREQFCEKGFEGTSVRDICDQANANVSAIKYHFGGKEGLYRECFKVYGESRLDSASKILTHVDSVQELNIRLKLFCDDFIKEGFKNLHTTKMICREIETENPLIGDIFQETFLKVYATLVEMLEDAQKKNLIRNDIDISIAASLFFHSLTTSIRLDHIGGKYFNKTLRDPKYVENFINNIVTIIFDGLKIQE